MAGAGANDAAGNTTGDIVRRVLVIGNQRDIRPP